MKRVLRCLLWSVALHAALSSGQNLRSQPSTPLPEISVEVTTDGNTDKSGGYPTGEGPTALQTDKVFGGDPNDPTLVNWSGQTRVHNVHKHHPKTYDEVVGLVQWARSAGRKIRALGVCHSWSNVFPEDNSEVIFLDHFKAMRQNTQDPTIVTVQAGVLYTELASWADSNLRGGARFTYLPTAPIVQEVTVVGSFQTAAHGSSLHMPPTSDYVIGATFVDAEGNLRTLTQGDPELKVVTSCLGMCGIVLDVTLKFDADPSAVRVSQWARSLQDLIPPRGVPINESYNPLKWWAESHESAEAIWVPFGAALWLGMRAPLEKYHQQDWIMTHGIDRLRGQSVPCRDNYPVWGTQFEPYYDLEIFKLQRIMGAVREKIHEGKSLKGTFEHIDFKREGFNYFSHVYNCSLAAAHHLGRYPDARVSAVDFEVAWKVHDDFSNIYEAHHVIREELDRLWFEGNLVPIQVICAIRFSGASSTPLSHFNGEPGDRFATLEFASPLGNGVWNELVGRVLPRLLQIKGKDGSMPRPHWAKATPIWDPEITPFFKNTYASQIPIIRDVVLRYDPNGLFRTHWLSDVFELPL